MPNHHDYASVHFSRSVDYAYSINKSIKYFQVFFLQNQVAGFLLLRHILLFWSYSCVIKVNSFCFENKTYMHKEVFFAFELIIFKNSYYRELKKEPSMANEYHEIPIL